MVKLIVRQIASPDPMSLITDQPKIGRTHYFTSVSMNSFRIYWWTEGDPCVSIIDMVRGLPLFLAGTHYKGIPLDKLELVDMDKLRDLLPDEIAELVAAKFNAQRMQL